MNVRMFDGYGDFKKAVLDLLRENFSLQADGPYAVILPGGVTPLPVFKEIEESPFPVSENLHIMVSDERFVSECSSFYNYGKMSNMVNKLGIGKDRIIKVDTSIEFQSAADSFNHRITEFINAGGKVKLAVLGLGQDGHTASLFTRRNIIDGQGSYVVTVVGTDGPDRISVTPDLFKKVERVVILTSGEGKAGIVKRLEESPGDVVAGVALAGVKDVEIWYSKAKG